MLALHDRYGAACAAGGAACRVHIDVLPAMTGVSRFLERPGFAYAKTEQLPDAALQSYALLLSARDRVPGFARVAAVEGFARLALRRAPWPLQLHTAPQVFLHERAA